MEQLVIMKQRIKTVETIKKVTHAMRLVSMSSHKKLQEKKKNLSLYKKSFESLWTDVHPLFPETPEKKQGSGHLFILVGSQKGLCGTFNTTLFKFFDKQEQDHPSCEVIGIGSYAIDYLKAQKIPQIAQFKNFTYDQFTAIARAVAHLILDGPQAYESVTLYSNKQKTFFAQQPQATRIYPLTTPDITKAQDSSILFEQSPETLRTTLEELLLLVTIQELLFESLASEQAARFISMDSSTRNAENLLTSMKRGYNKVRQAGITRELTELSTAT